MQKLDKLIGVYLSRVIREEREEVDEASAMSKKGYILDKTDGAYSKKYPQGKAEVYEHNGEWRVDLILNAGNIIDFTADEPCGSLEKALQTCLMNYYCLQWDESLYDKKFVAKAKALGSKVKEDFSKIILELRYSVIDDDLAELFNNPEYSSLLQKFENDVNAELEKVKKADERLDPVALSFEETYQPVEGEQIFMMVDPNDPFTILVNAFPFMTPYPIDELSDESKYKVAIEEYINISRDSKKNPGQHAVQHECAHIIDLLENGEERLDMHDELFEAERRKLNSKTHLDK